MTVATLRGRLHDMPPEWTVILHGETLYLYHGPTLKGCVTPDGERRLVVDLAEPLVRS